ncbi:hypothetical protein J437_LFUL018311 [Ladona fulva]|uniref:Retrovirus-related Pol polyprotein from transposon TNT 1-94-like beta-barrel domain-containing protein n=1 Tax=Ladona fulva TaxID=123851 RepID=A0A8K0PDR6_LADFU|nr:hypothetical protein J437_LFUL018311 [Ladona fulva]
MLSGLTPEYDPMVMALENSNIRITNNLIKGILLQEDAKRQDGTEKALLAIKVESDGWYVDSGVTSQMTMHKNWLVDHKEESLSMSVTVANNSKMKTAGHCNVLVNLEGDDKGISDVLYVPDLSTNLLSVSKLVSKGINVIFNEKGCELCLREKFEVNGEVVATADCMNSMYKLNLEDPIMH